MCSSVCVCSSVCLHACVCVCVFACMYGECVYKIMQGIFVHFYILYVHFCMQKFLPCCTPVSTQVYYNVWIIILVVGETNLCESIYVNH